jgi:hypothetical protein
MSTNGTDELRTLLLGLSEGGKREVSNLMMFEVLGLKTEFEKSRLRRRMQMFLKRGEVERVPLAHLAMFTGDKLLPVRCLTIRQNSTCLSPSSSSARANSRFRKLQAIRPCMWASTKSVGISDPL